MESMSWRYIINPSGNLVEVADDVYKELIGQPGFSDPQEGQVKSFLFRQKLQTELKDAPSVYLKTSKDRRDGYGESQEWLIDAMALEGINLTREYTGQKVGFIYGYPHHIETLQTPIKLIYTMFESTVIPEEWVRYLRMADHVYVPAKFCQEAFAARGINSTVVPLGISEAFSYVERDFSTEPFTFLHYDAFNQRKGWDLLFRAFTEEFTTNEARLILKTIRRPLPITKTDYPNVDVIAAEYSQGDMLTLLSDAHCFVFPSRGEGFGFPPLEAMASGIPAIIPNKTGMSEYFDERFCLELETKPVSPVYQQFKQGVGVMYEATIESLRSQLRWAYEHRQELEQMGIAASEHAKTFTIRNTAKRFATEFTRYLSTDVQSESNRPRLAFIMDNVDFYSGGRYHNTMQAIKLHEYYEVTVYTNKVPTFLDDFKWYRLPTFETCDLTTLDIEADVYFGSPEPGSLKAMELGKKYGKPVFVQTFDSPKWIEESEYTTPGETKRDHDMRLLAKELDLGPDDLTFIVNTENAIDSFAEWYSLPREMFTFCHPPLNSRVIDLFGTPPRQPWIYAASRIHMRKAWDETLMAFKPYADQYQLHVISQHEGKLREMARSFGIEQTSLVIHSKVSDLEKYAILSQCSAGISSSRFEGFGMWATECRAMGVPMACYDLPSLKEVDGGLYRAEIGNVQQLSARLGEALMDTGRKRYTDHDFDVIGDQLMDIVGRPVKPSASVEIAALYIVLNEQQYVRQSLESVLKRPEVKEVIIVEGADRRYPRANKNGLSVDDTARAIRSVIKRHPGKRIIYERHGWADGGKEELRQRCIDLSSKQGWGLYVDGDEVWSDDNWQRLIDGIAANSDKGIIYYKHHHFWKRPDLVAVGGQWDQMLFRLFRFTGNNKITFHGGAPTNTKEHGIAKLPDVYVHHYGYMKSADDVKAKLAYYAKRDTKLTVKDTWTDWKEGKPTQPTHGGGTVEAYTGEHPEGIA